MPRTGKPARFIGRYYHALEQKGRVSIPPSLRHPLGQTAILTIGLDGCLFLFPESNWVSVVESAAAMPLTHKPARDWVRLLANNAVNVNFDHLGRILIPDYLRTHAKLSKNVVIVGSLTRIEIWDQTIYHHYLQSIASQAETIAAAVTPSNLEATS